MKRWKWALVAVTLLSTSVAGARAWGWGRPRQAELECKAFHGPFRSQTGDPCESPIGLCTHGALEGEFAAQYDFTFETLESANDANDPSKFVYSGYSVVTTPDGVLHTDDTGVIHMTESGPAPFVTKAIVVEGTKKLANVDGGFVATGSLTFEDGAAVGRYSAVLCKPSRR